MLRLLTCTCLSLWIGSAVLCADDSASSKQAADAVIPLLNLVLDADESTARQCLELVTRAIQNDELPAERIAALREQLGKRLKTIYSDAKHPLRLDAALLAAGWQDSEALRITRDTFADRNSSPGQRLA